MPRAKWVEPSFPFFSSVVDGRKSPAGRAVNNLTPRGVVLNLGGDCWACFDVDLLRYSRTTKGDLPEGASLEDIDQALLTEVLVDQVDLDGDKVGEVVTMTTSFEGATYKIYRRQKGQWASVYEFYSYRCAY